MLSAARLIVCERTGRWAAALRREWGPGAVRVREIRNLGDAQLELRDAPASLVLVELTTTNLEPLVAWLLRLAVDWPQARVVVLSGTESAAAEFVLREAGAAWFIDSPQKLAEVIRVARRQLAGRPSPDPTWREHLFGRLPWPAQATPDLVSHRVAPRPTESG